MVGDYEIWAFAQPVKDWRLVPYKSLYGPLGSLVEMGSVTSCRGDPPKQWGPAYQWFYLGLKQSEYRRLDIPNFPQEELYHVSSRD